MHVVLATEEMFSLLVVSFSLTSDDYLIGLFSWLSELPRPTDLCDPNQPGRPRDSASGSLLFFLLLIETAPG